MAYVAQDCFRAPHKRRAIYVEEFENCAVLGEVLYRAFILTLMILFNTALGKVVVQ
jgi:hypothetical protein